MPRVWAHSTKLRSPSVAVGASKNLGAFGDATCNFNQAVNLTGSVPNYEWNISTVENLPADSNLVTWDGLDTPDDILQKIIYNAGRRNIDRVWVQGREVAGYSSSP